MTKQNGFTLVELAIALMVIGLLIGGVLKGQELIDNARVTAFVRQFQAYDTAIMIFRNTYNALPGDIKRPNRIPNCTAAICNLPGNQNGTISSNDHEGYNLFTHLTKANMIQGVEGGVQEEYDACVSDQTHETCDKFFPIMPIGTVHFPDDNTPRVFMTTKEIAKIDEKMDDGDPTNTNGRIRTEDCTTKTVDGKQEYDIDAADTTCGSWIAFDAIKPFWK